MKWLHNLLKGASLTGALFVFQACYGTPMPPLYDEFGEAPMTFSLVSGSTGKPIEGVRILSNPMNKENYQEVGITRADGSCYVKLPYNRNFEGPFIHFEGPDGLYAPKDTALADLRERTVLVKLNPVE